MHEVDTRGYVEFSMFQEEVDVSNKQATKSFEDVALRRCQPQDLDRALPNPTDLLYSRIKTLYCIDKVQDVSLYGNTKTMKNRMLVFSVLRC